MSKSSPLYREVLKKSFSITWKNKWLWIFGLFAALLGSGMAYESFFKQFDWLGETGWFAGATAPMWFRTTSFFASFKAWGVPWQIIITALVGLLICLGFIFLAVVSYGALVHAARKLLRGKAEFKESFLSGIKNFWHILGYNAIGKVAAYLLLFLAALPLGWYLKTGGTLAFSVYALVFIISLAASLIVSFLTVFAAAGRIVLGEDFWESIKNSLFVFGRHWLVSIEMMALLFLINLAAAFVLATAIIFLTVPFTFLFWGVYLLNSTFAFWIIFGLALIVLFALLLLVGSFMSAWNLVSWTVLYMRMVDETAVSKIIRLTKAIPRYFKIKK